MIGDILVKIANGETLTQTETDELRLLNYIDIAKPQIRSLSQITEDLGHVRLGSVICGTGDPFDTTSGNFSGMGIFNPPLTYPAGDFHLVGANAGILQAGISADDGKFYAAGGEVILDADGITITLPSAAASPNSIKWKSGTSYPTVVGSWVDSGDSTTNIKVESTGLASYPTADVILAATSNNGTKTALLYLEASNSASSVNLIADAAYLPAVTEVNGNQVFTEAGGTITGDLAIGGSFLLAKTSGADNSPVTAHVIHGVAPGTAANGLGAASLVRVETSDGTMKDGSLVTTSWVDASTVSRKARMRFQVYDTSPRECLRMEADGSVAMIGFLGAAAVARPSAYTQTYSTADKTHATPTAAALTDNTGGTANTTLAAVEATYTQATIRNNFADLAAMVNKNTADHLDLAQLVNALIDDLQSLGLVA